MLDPRYLTVLRKIYARLHDSSIDWVLTGSLSLALQGLPVEVHDVDLQTDEAGAYEIERRFAEFVIQKVRLSPAERICSHLGALSIDGIKVEVMGDIQKRQQNGTWEPPVNLCQYKQMVVVEGMQIPVLSLEYEYQAYRKLGRTEKAELLRKWLEKQQAGRIKQQADA